jgi:hypothetical protein
LQDRTKWAIFLFSVAASSGCQHWPDSYAPPAQRAFLPAEQPRARTMVRMDDVDLDDFVVRDVWSGDGDAQWRWSFANPSFQFTLEPAVRYRSVLEFAVAENTFSTTGPVTVAFSVNGHALAENRYDKAGRYRFEQAVPGAWIEAGKKAVLAASVSPVFTSSDKKHFGIILIRAGFEPVP